MSSLTNCTNHRPPRCPTCSCAKCVKNIPVIEDVSPTENITVNLPLVINGIIPLYSNNVVQAVNLPLFIRGIPQSMYIDNIPSKPIVITPKIVANIKDVPLTATLVYIFHHKTPSIWFKGTCFYLRCIF